MKQDDSGLFQATGNLEIDSICDKQSSNPGKNPRTKPPKIIYTHSTPKLNLFSKRSIINWLFSYHEDDSEK